MLLKQIYYKNMDLFNLNELKRRIKRLEGEIFPKDEDKDKDFYGEHWSFSLFLPSFLPKSLKRRVDELEDAQEKNGKLLTMLLDYLGLEYVKITEENGDKKTVEKLRKKLKKKSVKKK